MFKNIGKKIKVLAVILCWIGITASVIAAIVMIFQAMDSYYFDDMYIVSAIIVLLVGPLLSWVASFFMYGFGELIDKTCVIAKNTEGLRDKPVPAPIQMPTPVVAPAPMPVVAPTLVPASAPAPAPVPAMQNNANEERLATLEQWRQKGLITEEEYQRKKADLT